MITHLHETIRYKAGLMPSSGFIRLARRSPQGGYP